jgi:putative transcriptional regulator
MIVLDSTHDILLMLGDRMARKRLDRNWTQAEVSLRSGVPLGTLRKLESTGKGSMEAYICILRVLGALDALDQFISRPAVSPVEMAKLRRNKQRQRASRPTSSVRNKPIF